MSVKILFRAGLLLGSCLSAAFAQEPAAAPAAAEAAYNRACAACHVPAPPLTMPGAAPAPAAPPPPSADAKAPTRDVLRQFTPEAILNALTNGKMQLQGAALSAAERRAVAELVTGKTLLASMPAAQLNLCRAAPPMGPPAAPGWNGWGNGLTNTRFQPLARGGLSAADLPRLTLRWAFGYANVSSARAQPALVGGRLFVASENGEVLALDPKTGCAIWRFRAQSGVRTALIVGRYRSRAGRMRYAVYFGDTRANAYAVDAQSGRQIWSRKVDPHPVAGITGALAVHDGRVFVPVQGVAEETMGGTRKGYECCTFRGSLVALDAGTGAVLWKTYTVGESRPRARNSDGVQMYGPAGGSIWSSPTVDARRGLVYVSTGDSYADPAQPMTDAVLALELGTGAIRWVRQVLQADTWALGCPPSSPDNPACPAKLGPDFDFSAAAALVSVQGRDLLVIPQKSGIAYALDPDHDGQILWQYRYGQGSAMGGQWGGAIDAEKAYFGVADLLTQQPGGLHAVNLADGRPVWTMPPQPKLCGDKRGCIAGQGGALTAIPGAVLSGGMDGAVRAYSSSDGSILWLFDTNREFATVNAVKASGGGMDGAGIIVAAGMLFVNSGNGGLVGPPGNVLLAFGID